MYENSILKYQNHNHYSKTAAHKNWDSLNEWQLYFPPPILLVLCSQSQHWLELQTLCIFFYVNQSTNQCINTACNCKDLNSPKTTVYLMAIQDIFCKESSSHIIFKFIKWLKIPCQDMLYRSLSIHYTYSIATKCLKWLNSI